MIARGGRYLLLSALRTRAPVLGMVAFAFVLIGTYVDPRADAGSTWASTALLAGALAAWIVGATLGAEPDPQAEIAAAALGGRAGRLRLDALLVVAVAAALTAGLVGYPLALSTTGRAVFDRAPDGLDVLWAVVAHLLCGLVGGTVGLTFAPPRVLRRATAAVATFSALLALIIVAVPLRPFGGPLSIGIALSDAPLHHTTTAELDALASTVVLLAALALGLRAWTARVR